MVNEGHMYISTKCKQTLGVKRFNSITSIVLFFFSYKQYITCINNIYDLLLMHPAAVKHKCENRCIVTWFIFLSCNKMQKCSFKAISELLALHIPAQSLRSAEQMLLIVPRSRLKHGRDQPCAVASKQWNSLLRPIGTCKYPEVLVSRWLFWYTFDMCCTAVNTHCFWRAYR